MENFNILILRIREDYAIQQIVSLMLSLDKFPQIELILCKSKGDMERMLSGEFTIRISDFFQCPLMDGMRSSIVKEDCVF